MRRLGYLLAFVALLTVVRGFELGGAYNFYGLAVSFGVLPLLDVLVGHSRKNPSDEEALRLERSWYFRAVTWLWVPVQTALLVWGASVVGRGALEGVGLAGFIVSTGVFTGGVGITLAHELGHRNVRGEQLLAKLLLVEVGYLHFFIEHNRGHHVHVGTPRDPATARLHESLWAFLPRTVIGQYKNAWRLEQERLARRGLALLHWRNHMLWGLALPLVIASTLGLAFGPLAAAYFLGQGVIAVFLLECVNYLEHYGLVRAEIEPGRYEKVAPRHSWNSSHLLSGWFLFSLPRHSDHHAFAGRRYPILRHHDDAPQLPLGYPSMVLLALLPPLWFRVMNPRVEALSKRAAG